MRFPLAASLRTFALASTVLAGQVSQREQPNTPTRPGEPMRLPSEQALPPGRAQDVPSTTPLQTPPITRPGDPAVAPPQGVPSAGPCNRTSSGTPAFPGVSASQLPRAGVSADAFVRPGVSTAQLSVLLPGARTSQCPSSTRDVILYPDTGRPSRPVPPPGEDHP